MPCGIWQKGEIDNDDGNISCYTFFMRVIGIDPGIEKTGFAILEKEQGKIQLLDFGCLITDKKYPFPNRLYTLVQDLKMILKQWVPLAAGLEEIFFSKNVKTAIKVAHARGVILEVLEEYGIFVKTFNPSHIKLAVTGDAKADKKQMQKMIHYLMGIALQNDDTVDAIACGIAFLNTHDTFLQKVPSAPAPLARSRRVCDRRVSTLPLERT